MVDMSSYPVHVRDAANQMDLAAHAYDRALQGAKWLNEHGPRGWRLEMIGIHEGKVSSYVRMHRSDENPLALAFRRDATLQSADGRVLWTTVAKRFGFAHHNAHFEAQELGFHEMKHVVGSVIISEDVDAYFLNEAWEKILCNFSHEHNPVRAYQKAA
jgi:hypothetical protein